MKLPLLEFPTKLDSDGKFENNFEGVSYSKCNPKYSNQMNGLLYEPQYERSEIHYYDFYLDMGFNQYKKIFKDNDVRYDLIYMEGGTPSQEYIKTSGHFHKKIEGQDISYPEIYQVIQGKAVFILQKVDDWEKEDEPLVVEDCILVEVNAGETVIIPPNYGHCAVNVTDEPMIFIDLISIHSDNDYASIKQSRGMCCYILKFDDSYRVEKNENYIFNTEIRKMNPKESSKLGTLNNHS
ncbi:glucose-6-phosphate isomerase family protein, partial [Tetragenococcus muriaticus]